MIHTYIMTAGGNFPGLRNDLLSLDPVNTGSWQGMDISGSKLHATHELTNVRIRTTVSPQLAVWQSRTQADLPWAEDHFMERVSGQALNPTPSHEYWPWNRGNDKHMANGKFDHTYPERFWPKIANISGMGTDDFAAGGRQGIRFDYGDLNDVVDLLVREPMTRQAYLPVWFPEDTGAKGGTGRVPCTLGYQFLIRQGFMTMTYFMRSCDYVRHLRNDIYMAGRLLQWVVDEFNRWSHDGTHPNGTCEFEPVRVGDLDMFITSLHLFVGDAHYAS